MAASPARALDIESIRFGQHPDEVRMVLDLSQDAPFHVFVLDNPHRMIIDLPTFNWKVGQVGRPAGVTIRTVRQGKLTDTVARVVIDFDHPVMVKSAFVLPRSGEKPDRLVVDFTKTARFDPNGKSFGTLKTERATPVAGKQPAAENMVSSHTAPLPGIKPAPEKPVARVIEPEAPPMQIVSVAPEGMPLPPRKPADSRPAAAADSRPEKAEKKIIVIDAGHGGVDPGALAANGLYEKNITLAMARELKSVLEQSGRYKVIMTRSDDRFLRLGQRVAIARRHEADLFISLHADSVGRGNVKGASLYTLSDKASDEQTAMLADRENRADLVAGMDLNVDDEQVATILADLAVRDTMNQSKFFAGRLVAALDNGQIKLLENPHRSAGFAVLKAPDVPSVLVELGFLSNRREADQLSRQAYRANIARALAGGIDAYFDKIRTQNRS